MDLACVLATVALVYRVIDAGPWLDDEGSRRLTYTRIGESMALQDVSWAEADRHLLLVVGTACLASEESTGFYRRLAAVVAATPGVRLLAVSEEPEAAVQHWLDAGRIDVDRVVREMDLLRFGLSETPSILLVDDTGRVSGAMVGKLTEVEEQRVLETVTGRGDERTLDNIDHVAVISRSEEAAFRRRAQPVVVDVREREIVAAFGEHDRVNIPLRELSVRAPVELSAFDAILLDCSVITVPECRSAAAVLKETGFDGVTLLGD